MIPVLRQSFNAKFTPEKYKDFLSQLDAACGTKLPFRVCETPCFLPAPLLDEMCSTGEELVRQLIESPDYMRASRVAVPAEFDAPNESPTPMFVQVDFGLVQDADGKISPCLVELQAFPSLYGYQAVLSQQYIESYGLARELKFYLGGLDAEAYQALLRRVVVGQHDPENVVLLDIDPLEQKTQCDFLITEKMCGIRTVNITALKKQGNRLFYEMRGRLAPIHRIYNRAIVDELVNKNVQLPFDFRDPLEVEWAGHPNWYFRISKFSIPHLRHASVPRTWFLDALDQLPADRENYLLKPLYSFAGAGIVFAPTDAQIAAIPAAERHNYILQERMNFAGLVATPHGCTQAEIRIMYIWPDGEARMRPVLALTRMGRGKMMGVDHNKDLEWVGASAALHL